MSGPYAGTVPGMSPSILAAASREIDRAVADLIPHDKKGAAVIVVDKNGVGLGMAMKHGKHFTAELTLLQRWATESPTVQFKVKATW